MKKSLKILLLLIVLLLNNILLYLVKEEQFMASHTKESLPTTRIERNDNELHEYVMEINPLNIKSVKGKTELQPSSVKAPGVLIPMYAYPNFNEDSNNDGVPNYNEKGWWFRQLIDALKEYPDIAKIVIVNPDSGPGTTQDENYTRAIEWLHREGAVVVGYVSTKYSVYNPDNPTVPGRTISEVENDIDTWLKFYPEIDGVFLDELPWKVTGENGIKALQYYITLTNHAHKKGLYPVIGNPGVKQENNSYFTNNAYDIGIIYESAGYPTLSLVMDEIDPHRKAILIHSVKENSLEIKKHISELQKAAYHFWVWRDNTWGSDTTTWDDSGFANFTRYIANALDVKSNGGGVNPNSSKEIISISYPEEEWPIAKIDRNNNGIADYYMEINAWNIKSAYGKASMVYDNNTGKFSYSQNLSNIVIKDPKGWVLGYPEVYYGNKPWNGNRATDGEVLLPEKVGNLNNFSITLNYDIQHAKGLPVNLSLDSWLTKDKWRSTGIYSDEVEIMVWLYYDYLQPAGSKISEISVPIIVNGKYVDATFEIWQGYIGWKYIAFKIKDPIKAGEIRIPFLPFINEVKNIVIPNDYNSLYLEDVEVGTEFGSPNTSSANLSWVLSKFFLNTNPSSPQNLKAKVYNSSVILSWDPSTKGSFPISGYAIYRTTEQGKEDLSQPIVTVNANTTTYIDKNLEFNKTYYYVVKAYDNQSPPNYSISSNELKVEIKDTVPPTITVETPNDSKIVNEDTVIVLGKVLDNQSSVSKLTINGDNVSISSDGTFNKTIKLHKGENTIIIIAEDKAGNKSTFRIAVNYQPKVIITLKPNNPIMTVNGTSEEIDPGRGTTPVIIKEWGRTVVPIRAIVEALGGITEWDAEEREVTIKFKDSVIKVWVDKPQAIVNGVMKWIDLDNHSVKPIIVNGRTMLPLRFIAESLGCIVNWDEDTMTITISYGG